MMLSQQYVKWRNHADLTVIENRQSARSQGGMIRGAFRAMIALDRSHHRGDGDNRIKALLDWAQSREYVENDSLCAGGSWEWVGAADAPCGARLTIIAAAS